jgi:Tol biopolymer transport system component
VLRTVPAVLVAVAALAAGAAATAPSAPPPQVAGEIVWVSWATGPAILFESNGVWSVRPNGTGLRRLTAVEGGEPSWSPNGRRIALSWGDAGIAVMNPDGSGLRHIRRREGMTPMWSPDGERIAFTTPRGVWTIGADGRGLRRVASLRYGIDPAREHDWSQDGNQIVFSQCLRRVPQGQLCHATRGASAVFTASAERSGPARRISRGHGWCPDWGTDGRMAYNSFDAIVVSRANGSAPRNRLRAPQGCSDWAPSGRLLAVQSKRGVMLANATGGRSWRLAALPALPKSSPYLGAPSTAWSPDGRWIAVARPVQGPDEQVSFRLYAVNVQTGRARVLLQTRS